MNGHCSHLKHFTFGRAVTKLAVKLATVDPDADENFVLFDDAFDSVSTILFDGDGGGDDDDDGDDDNDGDDDLVDDGCVDNESLVILWLSCCD